MRSQAKGNTRTGIRIEMTLEAIRGTIEITGTLVCCGITNTVAEMRVAYTPDLSFLQPVRLTGDTMSDEDDTTVHEVVINHEEQYSIWPQGREIPPGWNAVGKSGLKPECLEHISEVWTDMRPLSLRNEIEARRTELEKEEARRIEKAKKIPRDQRDNLVEFLATGKHPVETGLRPEKTVKIFKEAIDRGYVHVRFTDTRGGTELGLGLGPYGADLSKADFENETGIVHLEGELTLNKKRVRCVADFDLATLSGEGHLAVLEG